MGRIDQKYIYAGVIFLFWFSLYLYVPTLPIYIQTKTNQLALVGVVLSMYGLWQAVVRLPLGITSDLTGQRRWFMILGLVFSACGAIVMMTAQDITWLAVGRSTTGLASASWVPMTVAFTALFPPADSVRASALLSFLSSFSRMIASGLTGFINNLGGYSLAFVIAAAVAVIAIGLTFFTRETGQKRKDSSIQSIGRLIIRGEVMLPSLLGTVNQFITLGISYGFAAVLAKEMDATNEWLSLILTVNLGANMVASLITSQISKKTNSRTMVYASYFLLCGGVGLAAFAPNLILLAVAQIISGFGTGIGYPILMGKSIEYVAGDEKSIAMGVFQSVYAIGMFGGPWLCGVLADEIGLRPMFGLTAGVCLIAGLFGTTFLITEKKE